MKSKLPKRKLTKATPRPVEPKISPEQALQFLEDVRVLYSTKDEPTKMISIRIPENVLRLLKTRATSEGKRYQSLMIELLRSGLKPSKGG